MKKTIFTIIMILIAVFCAYGQNNSPIDLVLLLDTSSTMSSSYDNVNNYITGAFLKEFLRVGDTFHLIAFSSNPRFDCARRILGIGDIETIIGRMLLQYPVETGSNISTALTYAERYVSYLPARQKKIVLVTVGSSDTNNLVNASKQRLNSRNTTLDYIQVTSGTSLSNLPKSGRPAAVTASRTTTTTPAAAAARPSAETSSRTGTTGTAGGTGTGTGTGTTAGTGTGTGAGTNTGTSTNAGTGTNTGTGTTAGTGSPGEAETQVQGSNNDSGSFGQTQKTTSAANDDSSVSETGDSSTFTSFVPDKKKDNSVSFATSFPVIIFIVILLLLILGLIIYLASRKLGSSPNRVMADVASSGSKDRLRFADHSKDLAKYAAVQGRRSTPYDDKPVKPEKYNPVVINPSSPLLLNLFVEEQSTSIGKRNIHSLKSGYSLSVGGGKSDDYHIFLVPMPSHLGEIRRDGSILTFIPKKPNYFPDNGSKPIKDCINKTIRIISDKNYEIRFRFEMYEDPIIALNRMLMSVKIPG